MAKKVYQVPGTKFTRTTDREYTHAVISVNNETGEARGEFGFCGSRVLAEKQLIATQRIYGRPDGHLEIREVVRIK